MAFFTRFVGLWSTRDELQFRNIRKGSIKYFMAFPLMVLFINFEYKYFLSEVSFNGYDMYMLLPLSFCIGSLFVLFVKEPQIVRVSHISAIVMIVGFAMRFFQSDALCFWGSLVCWMGVGACGVGAWLCFCVKLNNAERLAGILLEIVIINIYMLLSTVIRITYVADLTITSVILICFAACILTFREKDIKQENSEYQGERRRENYWGLAYALAYFVILQLFNKYIATSMEFSDMIYAVGGLGAVVIALVIQFACKRSSWQMWNVLLLAAALATVMFWFTNIAAVRAGSLFVGIFNYSGDIVLFYACAGAIKRAYSFRYFKRFLFAFYGILIASYFLTELIAGLGEYRLLIILSVFIGAVFVIFIFLSSTLYDKFLASDWSSDLRSPDMNIHEKSGNEDAYEETLNTYGLTRREKEVCDLLLEGRTLRQISADIGIGFSTVNTHYKNLYRKLGINSRAELFRIFGIKSQS